MFDKFKEWYVKNNTEITWFITGFLSMDAIVQAGHGNLIGALISGGLAAANVFFIKRGW